MATSAMASRMPAVRMRSCLSTALTCVAPDYTPPVDNPQSPGALSRHEPKEGRNREGVGRLGRYPGRAAAWAGLRGRNSKLSGSTSRITAGPLPISFRALADPSA